MHHVYGGMDQRDDTDGDDDGESETEFDSTYGESVSLEFTPDQVLVPILRRVELKFDGRADGEQVAIVANEIDTSFFARGSLTVIVHSRSGWTTSASLEIQAQNVSVTEDAPDVTFVDTEVSMASFNITATSPTTLPFFAVVPMPSGSMGAQMRVELRFNQGAFAAAGAQTIVLSAFILGRAC